MQATFRVLRYNPEKDKKAHYEDYTLDVHPTMTILDVLHQIKWNYDGTLSFRRSCAHGICGSDGIKINGKNGLACSLLLKEINLKKTVVLEPLPHLPIIKDLIVDMTEFYQKLDTIKPYLIVNTPPPVDGERRQSNEDAELLFESAKCILCSCCTTSCPSTWTNENYLGPAALLKAFRFAFDTRDEAGDERLSIIDNSDGAWRCHTIFNCNGCCPKEINITWHISQLKKAVSMREL